MEIYSHLNFYNLFWIFFIGCIGGVLIETIWCFLRFHRIESRKGLVFGPFNLVYGFGALIMTLSLSWLCGKRDLWVFLLGSLIGGAFEYICSFIQEKLFGTVSWDYKKFPLNLHGRVTLLYSLFWGVLSVVWVKDVSPHLISLADRLLNRLGVTATWVLFAFMIFDTVVSALAAYRARVRHQNAEAKGGKLWNFFDRHFSDERMKRIYPNMRYTK